MASWIEITNPIHGGAGWEFGACLWSPQKNRGGGRSWQLMTEIQAGDRIFHFLKQKKGAGYYIVGTSLATTSVQTIESEPPEANEWAGMSPYYRVPVENFVFMPTTISIDELLKTNSVILKSELNSNPTGQFFEMKASGKLQISLKYIAKAEGVVETLLESLCIDQIQYQVGLEGESFTPSDTTPAYPDYTPLGTIQTRVTRKIRDTKLSKQTKEIFEHYCAICGYRIPLNNGKFYAEANHLKPLGAGHNGPDTADNLIVLCPTHHAEFDYGAIAIQPEDMSIASVESNHEYKDKNTHYALKHLNNEFIEYHFRKIFRGIR